MGQWARRARILYLYTYRYITATHPTAHGNSHTHSTQMHRKEHNHSAYLSCVERRAGLGQQQTVGSRRAPGAHCRPRRREPRALPPPRLTTLKIGEIRYSRIKLKIITG